MAVMRVSATGVRNTIASSRCARPAIRACCSTFRTGRYEWADVASGQDKRIFVTPEGVRVLRCQFLGDCMYVEASATAGECKRKCRAGKLPLELSLDRKNLGSSPELSGHVHSSRFWLSRVRRM